MFLNFLQPTLPGVFDDNNVIAAVNGSLWTLKVEIMFYMSVPLFVFLFRRFSYLPVMVLIYCTSVAYVWAMTAAAERTGSGIYIELARQLPGALSFFISGGFLYYHLEFFEKNVKRFVASSIFILFVNIFYPLSFFQPFAFATMVIFFGLYWYGGNFGKYGDFSYGYYILHFPIIQVLVSTGWFRESPWFFLSLVVALTAVGSIVMWHLVEKRFLFQNSHYVNATSSSGDTMVDPKHTTVG